MSVKAFSIKNVSDLTGFFIFGASVRKGFLIPHSVK
jgi:hypothetical protein